MVLSAVRRAGFWIALADAAERLHQHADAEVESLQDEEAEEQRRDHEPQLLKTHGQLLSDLSVGERQWRDLVVAGWRWRRRFRVVLLRPFDDIAAINQNQMTASTA